MENPDFVKTTFIYKTDSQWKFKHIATLRRKKIRDITVMLLDRYIEDYEDLKIYDRVKNEIKNMETLLDWNHLKRSTGLDVIQDFT